MIASMIPPTMITPPTASPTPFPQLNGQYTQPAYTTAAQAAVPNNFKAVLPIFLSFVPLRDECLALLTCYDIARLENRPYFSMAR